MADFLLRGLSPADRVRIDFYAAKYGMTRSRYIRVVLRKEWEDDGPQEAVHSGQTRIAR